MAQDKKTYTIEIKTETDEATGEMKQLESVVKTTAGEFDNINSAIAGTEDALGKLDPVKNAKEFKVLSKELQDLRDQQEKVQLQSLRFSDALAETSGVTGILGQSLQGLRQTFIVLAANPLIAAFTLLSAGALALVESLKRTEEGTAALTRIGEAASGILDGLFKIVEPLALQFATFAEELLKNEELVNSLATAFAFLQGVVVSVASFFTNQFTTAIRTAGGILSTFSDAIDKVKEGDLKGAFSELGEIGTVVTDGFEDVVDNFGTLAGDLVDTVTTKLDERSDKIRRAIVKPYENAERDIREIQGRPFIERAELQAESQTRDEEFATAQIKQVELQQEEELSLKEEFGKLENDQKLELAQIGIASVANLVNENSKAGKALAVAQATIDTFRGANKALAQGGLFGIVGAASIITAGFANVRKILSTDPPEVPVPSGAGASGGGGGRGGGFTPPSPPQLPTIEPPQIVGDTQGVDTGRAVQESIERGNQRPVRAYVLDQDVTTQQQATRRSNAAANF